MGNTKEIRVVQKVKSCTKIDEIKICLLKDFPSFLFPKIQDIKPLTVPKRSKRQSLDSGGTDENIV